MIIKSSYNIESLEDYPNEAPKIKGFPSVFTAGFCMLILVRYLTTYSIHEIEQGKSKFFLLMYL